MFQTYFLDLRDFLTQIQHNPSRTLSLRLTQLARSCPAPDLYHPRTSVECVKNVAQVLKSISCGFEDDPDNKRFLVPIRSVKAKAQCCRHVCTFNNFFFNLLPCFHSMCLLCLQNSKHYLLYHSTQQKRVSTFPYVRPTICLWNEETCQRSNKRKVWWVILIWDRALFGLQVESAKWDLTVLTGACCQSQSLMYRANFGATLD